MNAHTREQPPQHRRAVNRDGSYPSLRHLASPFSRSTPNITALRLPDHLAVAAKQIHYLTWTYPTLGAASWHWEGSGPPVDQFAPSSIPPKEQLEGALLFAGLDVPDPEDYAGFLATGER
ncbi:unnamed protein product [Zymoseptoria tritici ST99CH_1A5]|uniref:Uncharacterized protein n=1 Tax=Zymoseptoria tritici ST99CH_1A5 TaxID=1276529 RepID=A0A1Y6M3A0_ZYMTR|nr:unnamed protein product [Zymoseptoria tritici ST99CH_3D1]SMY30369.1 unnamed protein product [Zymoseptoria tritici ST99CH_1A5]